MRIPSLLSFDPLEIANVATFLRYANYDLRICQAFIDWEAVYGNDGIIS
jgi:hypothetical protein